MKQSQEEPKKGAPAFMSTYGDMMTLLLTFFVLLFSMSTVDVAKFRALAASFDGGSGLLEAGDVIVQKETIIGNGIRQFPSKGEQVEGNGQGKAKAMKEDIEKYVYNKKLEEKVGVEQRGDEIIIRFGDALLFDTGKADIKPGAIPVLDTVGNKIKEYLDNGYRIRLEGHTDNMPIKTAQFPSNWELSAARAIAVAKFYIYEMNFKPAKISTEGFGEHEPMADNATADGRSMNRRVEIILVKDN
ncbi:MAG: flagellar motor protein MotB [Cellulosilyticaceae bacterium]